MASVEDTIVARLEWYRESDSERQLTDIRHMLRQQQDQIDFEYLHSRIRSSQLDDLWRRVTATEDNET